MSEEQISNDDIPDDDRRDAFRQSRVALIGVQGPAPCGDFAGMVVAEMASCRGIRIGADDPAAVRDPLRAGGKLMERVVKDRDTDSGHIMKILQQGVEFDQIEAGNHKGRSFPYGAGRGAGREGNPLCCPFPNFIK